VPNNDSALAASRKYGTKPHLAGSEQDLATARMFLDLFQTELGIAKPEDEPFFDAGSRQSQRAIRGTTTVPRRIHRPIAWIDTYYPVLNTGVDQKLELLNEDGSVTWEATLQEDGDPADPEAGKYKDAIPTWHGLSKGGDVTGPLVYVKYGRKEDFDSLVESGVDLTGTIALVRYGYVFRGLKVKAAQEAGCAGILIYSDPHDDGSVTESDGYKHWPHGPARNPTSVQRGSVQFLSSYPGDPTTPGYPSYKNATRMEATSIPSIPSLPISWKNARKLLQELGQDVTSSRKVRMVNEVDNKVIPIYNTMAVIPGFVTEQAVIVGNHRDGKLLNYPVRGLVLTSSQPGYGRLQTY
jgi:N-acetylated-alpha-linked acidic dipeptidase